MFRGLHNVCLNSSIGQPSLLSSSGLVGHFDPTEYTSSSSVWGNKISGQPSLKRNNSITLSSETPNHFLFDGADDFLSGEIDSYSSVQSEFVLPTNYWTLTSWVKGLSSAFTHILASTLNLNAYFALTKDGNGQSIIYSFSNLGTLGPASSSLSIPSSIDTSKWNQITITHDYIASMDSYLVYINGNYIGAVTNYAGFTTTYLLIGKNSYTYYDFMISMDPIVQTSFTTYGIKAGHTLVYNRQITNSEDRQNFNFIHDTKSSRVYGATYNA